LARARITVTERPVNASGRVVKAVVTTGVDGRFSYRVSGEGPSRAITVQYVKQGSGAVTRRLKLTVRAASRFRLSLRGVLVRYSGQVLSKPLAKGGTTVFIQGRAAGRAWQRFAVRRTDLGGRFSGRYRLRVRRPGVRLQFRVEIPKQSGYPFAAQLGAAVTRIVR